MATNGTRINGSRARHHGHGYDPLEFKQIKRVAEMANCPFNQAYGLLQRVKLQGFEYDTVDWANCQGEDLNMEERVERLEQAYGCSFPSPQEVAAEAAYNYRSMREKYEDQREEYEAWLAEQESE